MILAAKALLEATPNPSITEIKGAIAGNICRCTGYMSIIRAIQKKIIEAIASASLHNNTISDTDK